MAALDHSPRPPSWPPDPPVRAQDTTRLRGILPKKRKAAEFTDAERTLGKLATWFAHELKAKGWRRLVTEARGHSYISPSAKRVAHKAARLLGHLGLRGASVTMHTPPWTAERRMEALRRGPHKSSQGEREFVSEEMADFCRQGYWLVLPQDVVADWPNLRISPLGVVPQRDRRPRLIVDYLFSNVNAETVPLAPHEAMQFGRALQRVLSIIVHANRRYGPVHMAKIDIADGFYRVWLQIDDVPKLGVALPTAPGSRPLVAFPLALPMGWVLSPPYFTVLTETACDLANAILKARLSHTRITETHRLEAVAATPPSDADAGLAPSADCGLRYGTPPILSVSDQPPVAYADVYVDDFLLLAQTQAQQRKVLRSTLVAIDEVFRPLEVGDPSHRKEPASVKKMQKGDAHWSTWKRILGWDINTVTETLHLPPHRVARLHEVLSWLSPPRKRLPRKKWYQLLGELRSMSPALPGTRGLFSVLQDALSSGDRHRIRLNQHVYSIADDFRALVNAVASRPTRLRELVPTSPSDVGACDACQFGMGGVWFDALHNATAPPVLWRCRFPDHITRALVTSSNPSGTLSISDLELTGVIAHKDVLAHHRDVAERTMWLASDNRAAVSWATKGAATSTAARAYLLRFNAFHQRAHRYVARHHYIPGMLNSMADDASRLWSLSDAELLTHFNTTYPQANSWQMLHLRPATSATLIGALSRHQQPCADLLSAAQVPPRRGRCGRPSVPALASMPMSLPPPPGTLSLFSNCLHTATGAVPSPPVADLSGLARWRTPYERWARRTPGWGPRTLV